MYDRSENFEDFNLPQLLHRVNESAVNFGMFFQLEISLKRREQLLVLLAPEAPYYLLFTVSLSGIFFNWKVISINNSLNIPSGK